MPVPGERPICHYTGKRCMYEGAGCTCLLPGFQGTPPTWASDRLRVELDKCDGLDEADKTYLLAIACAGIEYAEKLRGSGAPALPDCPACAGSGEREVFVRSGGSMPENAGDGYTETVNCPDCNGSGNAGVAVVCRDQPQSCNEGADDAAADNARTLLHGATGAGLGDSPGTDARVLNESPAAGCAGAREALRAGVSESLRPECGGGVQPAGCVGSAGQRDRATDGQNFAGREGADRREPAAEAGRLRELALDLLPRIDAAIERITTGTAPMRVPAEPTDPDLVLAECKRLLRHAFGVPLLDGKTFSPPHADGADA